MTQPISSLIDFKLLAGNLGNDAAIIQKLLLLFLQTTEQAFAALLEAHQQADLENWKKILHNIKGASQNLGTDPMVVLSLEAESMERLPTQQSAAILKAMQDQWKLLQAAIQEYLANGHV